MNMQFSRGRVQILYTYLPGALFPHDKYGYCQVNEILLREDADINRSAVANTVADTLRNWPNDWQRPGFADPRDPVEFHRNYIVGIPQEVRFTPFPQMLQCRTCRHVYSLNELERSRSQPGVCPDKSCGGHLGQFQFVQAHNCGRLAPIHLETRGCRIHGTKGLYFDDTGRVMTARWRCSLCGGAEVARLRQQPCSCEYSAHIATSDSAKKMRFFAVSDPSVFKPLVVPFVNFDEKQLADLSDANARKAILARLWGLSESSVAETVRKSAALSTEDNPGIEDMIRQLESLDPNNKSVLEYRRNKVEARQQLEDLDKVLNLAGVETEEGLNIPRRMNEHAAILDTLHFQSVEAVASRLRIQGEDTAALAIEAAQIYANDNMGINKILALEDFPVGLCAVGYTRVSKAPAESILNPFPPIEGRTPLYTVTTTTEGLYFQLSPVRVVNWLIQNKVVSGQVPASDLDAWAWLYRNCEGLRAMPDEPEFDNPVAVAVRTLLHSISHVLLRNIEWSGYAAQSLGEYLIPEGLACVLYANRYTETTVGGLLTLFEQEMKSWLEASLQSGKDCIFDPFCSEEGGSCVGCIHREFNCPTFNHELSRATLYGGSISKTGAGALSFGDIGTAYWS